MMLFIYFISIEISFKMTFYLYLENKVGDLSFLFHILLVTKVLHLLSKFNQILYRATFLNTEVLLRDFHNIDFFKN